MAFTSFFLVVLGKSSLEDVFLSTFLIAVYCERLLSLNAALPFQVCHEMFGQKTN